MSCELKVSYWLPAPAPEVIERPIEAPKPSKPPCRRIQYGGIATTLRTCGSRTRRQLEPIRASTVSLFQSAARTCSSVVSGRLVANS